MGWRLWVGSWFCGGGDWEGQGDWEMWGWGKVGEGRGAVDGRFMPLLSVVHILRGGYCCTNNNA